MSGCRVDMGQRRDIKFGRALRAAGGFQRPAGKRCSAEFENQIRPVHFLFPAKRVQVLPIFFRRIEKDFRLPGGFVPYDGGIAVSEDAVVQILHRSVVFSAAEYVQQTVRVQRAGIAELSPRGDFEPEDLLSRAAFVRGELFFVNDQRGFRDHVSGFFHVHADGIVSRHFLIPPLKFSRALVSRFFSRT